MFNILLNVLWLITGGIISAFLFFISGLLWAITILGIPIALQCFKFAKLSLWPFGREIRYGDGNGALLVNILWILLGGLEIAVAEACLGLLLCATIVGIPFGVQHMKFAKLALMPVGAKVSRTGDEI